MKIMTIFGTRPEIIRLSLILGYLDDHCDHVTVNTGQNYHEGLSDVFIRDLCVRQPDVQLNVRANNFGDQIGQILSGVDQELQRHKPDRVLILGDTNSALSAIAAARRGIPVYHMEAGNRCYDDRVPEEINRRIVDHSSSVLLPYTHRSKDNLVREGIERSRIFVTGNPIKEVIDHFDSEIESSSVLERFNIASSGFFLVTLHRAENVDLPERLAAFFQGFREVWERFGKPLIISLHPRTAARCSEFGIETHHEGIVISEPLPLFDFIKLEKTAAAVLTDSGTVQEECCIFGVPNVTLRDVTERPETIECGSNMLCSAEPAAMVRALELVTTGDANWEAPAEYMAQHVARTVCNLILSDLDPKRKGC
jgi:UDP-N-acetylglucosamine 2-epimerase (non-hydrolysing)